MNAKRKFWKPIFIIYMIALIILVVIKFNGNIYAFFNIAGNIVPFIPLGFLLPIAFPQYSKILKSMPIAFSVILMIETFQFLTMTGYFDIDDII